MPVLLGHKARQFFMQSLSQHELPPSLCDHIPSFHLHPLESAPVPPCYLSRPLPFSMVHLDLVSITQPLPSPSSTSPPAS